MSKQYRPWSPEQTFLLPVSPLEWLPEGHLAYFVLEVVREMDLGAIEASIHAKDPRGERPYAPRMMTTLLLYAYCVGVFSSRKIERATYEDVAFRVIAGGGHPHFTTVNGFRLEHREALAGLFAQALKLCARAGLKTAGHVSLDGTKVQANASKHKAMSYGRMKEEEKRLALEIESLLSRAAEADTKEDAEYGRDKRGDELAEDLQRRTTRLQRIREAKVELEKEAAHARAAALRENAAELRKKAERNETPAKEQAAAVTLAAKADKQANELAPRDDDNGNDEDDDGSDATRLPGHRVQTTPDGAPKDKAQRNFTDADSRIMHRNGVFMQAYNAQAVVSEDQIIVAHGLTNDPTDTRHLAPMLERVRENGEPFPTVFTADSGYLSEENIAYCAKHGPDAYIAIRKSDAKKLAQPGVGGKLQAHAEMYRKLRSPEGAKLYARRKVIVEPAFGQIKGAMGFRRFSLRGLLNASAEWAIVATCHNLLKLFRRQRLEPAAATS